MNCVFDVGVCEKSGECTTVVAVGWCATLLFYLFILSFLRNGIKKKDLALTVFAELNWLEQL